MKTFHSYVMNLARDHERMSHMTTVLKSAGLNFTRVEAIDGKTINVNTFYSKERAIALHGSPLLKGEVGCALSHQKCLNAFLKSNYDYALIFEDDIWVPPDMHKRIKQLISDKKLRDTEYLLFDYTTPGWPFLQFWWSSIKINYLKPKPPLRQLHFIFYSILKSLYIIPLSVFEAIRNALHALSPAPVVFYRPLYLAGCYLVSRSGAQKLIASQTPLAVPADKLPHIAIKEHNLKFRAYSPQIAKQLKEVFETRINIPE